MTILARMGKIHRHVIGRLREIGLMARVAVDRRVGEIARFRAKMALNALKCRVNSCQRKSRSRVLAQLRLYGPPIDLAVTAHTVQPEFRLMRILVAPAASARHV